MPIPKECPRIWHCVFCGKHGPITDFQMPISGDLFAKKTQEGNFEDSIKMLLGEKITCCPRCREYKGLEPCNPETCDVWVLDVVRKLSEKEDHNDNRN